jgi:hypothetical protein
MIKTSMEQYVEQYGMLGTFEHLRNKIAEEKDVHKCEFFKTCRDLLTVNNGGRILDAARRFHADH